MVEIRDRSGASTEQHVMGFLLSDGTSVINVSVWGEAGEGVLNQMEAAEETASSGQCLVAHVQRFAVRKDDKVRLVPCRKLVVSSRNAKIEIRSASEEE